MNEQRIYARLEGESWKAYAAFEIYRDMPGKRSIYKAYLLYVKFTAYDRWVKGHKPLGKGKRVKKKPPSHWEEWASKYQWVKRARAYDNNPARRRESDHVDTIIFETIQRAKLGNKGVIP